MSWLLLLQGDPVEPGSLTGEAKGAEMQLLEAFGVRGGVGLPGTGLCWKVLAAPPLGDMLGTSVLMRAGKMPGLVPPSPTLCPEGPLGRMAGLMGPSPACWDVIGKFWWPGPAREFWMLAGIMLLCLMLFVIPPNPGPGPLPMLCG